jgi:hypothetical protein
LLALATVAAGFAVSGRMYEEFDELSLTRLGAFRSPDARFGRDAEGGPLRVNGVEYAEGFQTGPERPARFVLPPGFGLLRLGVGLQDQAESRPPQRCRAVFTVGSPSAELARSEAVPADSAPRWLEVPLEHGMADLVFTATSSECGATPRFNWIRPRLISWQAVQRSPDRRIAYLSDILRPSRSHGEWRRNASVRGGILRIGGRTYRKGLGVHADSVLEFPIPEGSCVFRAEVGYDDEVGVQPGWKQRFIVKVDGIESYRSPEKQAGDPATPVEVPVAGARRIALIVDALDQVDGDHADWADARFERGNPESGCTAEGGGLGGPSRP